MFLPKCVKKKLEALVDFFNLFNITNMLQQPQSSCFVFSLPKRSEMPEYSTFLEVQTLPTRKLKCTFMKFLIRFQDWLLTTCSCLCLHSKKWHLDQNDPWTERPLTFFDTDRAVISWLSGGLRRPIIRDYHVYRAHPNIFSFRRLKESQVITGAFDKEPSAISSSDQTWQKKMNQESQRSL